MRATQPYFSPGACTLRGTAGGREVPDFGVHGTPAPPDPSAHRPGCEGFIRWPGAARAAEQQPRGHGPAWRLGGGAVRLARSRPPARGSPSFQPARAFFLGGAPGRGSHRTLEDGEDERAPVRRPTRRGSPGRSAARAGPRQTIQNTFSARRRGNARPLLGDRGAVVNRERGCYSSRGRVPEGSPRGRGWAPAPPPQWGGGASRERRDGDGTRGMEMVRPSLAS